MKTQTNTLVVLAVVSNPFVWAAVCFGVAVMTLYVLYLYCREECRLPQRRTEPAPIDLSECKPVSEPTPVVQVDEFGRVEMYTPEPLVSAEKPRSMTGEVEVDSVVRAQVACSQEPRSESVPPRKPTARPKARSKSKPRSSGRKTKKVAAGGSK